jgi:hypothetical protein
MYLMTWKKPVHLASRIEPVGTPGQRSVKSINPGLSRENRDECDPYPAGNFLDGRKSMD